MLMMKDDLDAMASVNEATVAAHLELQKQKQKQKR